MRQGGGDTSTCYKAAAEGERLKVSVKGRGLSMRLHMGARKMWLRVKVC